MNNKQVAHLWANHSRSEASGSHFFFRDSTIFSYGQHFPIARHYNGVVLFTSGNYSASTARHISFTRSACNHLTSFTVADVLRDPRKGDLKDYRAKIEQAGLQAARARNPEFALIQLEKLVAEANHFASHFKFKTRFTVPGSTDLEKLKAKAAASSARERKATLAKKAKAEADAAETVAKWLAGERVTIPYNISKVFLRVIDGLSTKANGVIRGEDVKPMVETSKGATVPLAEAEKAFRFIALKRETGWHRNGETFKVGDFQLDAVNAQGINAGCHRIDWEVITDFAKAQGW